MSGLLIDAEACVGCGRCVRACASGGIVVTGERPHRCAHVTDSCILCGSCVDACPVGALSIEREEAQSDIDLSAFHDIWVFAQTDSAGTVLPVAFELLGRARELAAQRGCRVVAVVGETSTAGATAANELIAHGADEVLRCQDDRLAVNDSSVFAHWICALAREYRPEVILYGATDFGRELAPSIAVRLQTGLTADCTVLEMDEESGLLHQTRPALGGNLMATIMCPAHRPQMATVRPGIFCAPEVNATRTGRVTDVELDETVASRVRVVEHIPADSQASIAEAKRLLVLGRGIGSKKNLPVMRRLAELLGAEIGCTRPLVEAGWLEYRHQVGQTGVSVAPELLISMGVSGAIQHLAGVSGARTVVAVNEDADAPIFNAAQYAVVGDCVEVAQRLIAQLEAR